MSATFPKASGNNANAAISGAGAGTSTGQQLNIVSYNVLSPALCDPLQHHLCDAPNLHPKTRLDRVKRKLTEQALHPDKRAIVCLQEVGLSWQVDFEKFFEANGYKVYFSFYGNGFNDYMGILTAFPKELYELEDWSSDRLSEAFYDYARLSEVESYWKIQSQCKLQHIPENNFGKAAKKELYQDRLKLAFPPPKSQRERDLSDSTCIIEPKNQKSPENTISKVMNYVKVYGYQKNFILQAFLQFPGKVWRITKGFGSLLWREFFQQPFVSFIKLLASPGFPVLGTRANSLSKWLKNLVKEANTRPQETGWQIAERRQNRYLFLKLQARDGTKKTFAVGNYHNPCLFGNPEKVKALALHTSWLFQHFEKFAAQSPRILCGDFNMTADSEVYAYVTSDQYSNEKAEVEKLQLQQSLEKAAEASKAKEDNDKDNSSAEKETTDTLVELENISISNVKKSRMELQSELGLPCKVQVEKSHLIAKAKVQQQQIEKTKSKTSKSTITMDDYLKDERKTDRYNSFFPGQFQGMDSAYFVKHKKEPVYTNLASILFSPATATKEEKSRDAFCECLDYIFLSKGDWNVNSTVAVPQASETMFDGYDSSVESGCQDIVSDLTKENVLDSIRFHTGIGVPQLIEKSEKNGDNTDVMKNLKPVTKTLESANNDKSNKKFEVKLNCKVQPNAAEPSDHNLIGCTLEFAK